MRNKLFILFLLASFTASAQLTLVDTTKISVFDKAKSWHTQLSTLKAYMIPTGGTTAQVLTKNSGTDFDYSWADAGGGGGSDGNGIYDGSGTVPFPSRQFYNTPGGYGYMIKGLTNDNSDVPSMFDAIISSSTDVSAWETTSFDDLIASATNASVFVDNFEETSREFRNYASGVLVSKFNFTYGVYSDFNAIPVGLRYASDYSSTISTNDQSIPDVGTVKTLDLQGMNNLSTTSRDALSPSANYVVRNTDTDGFDMYNGIRWFRFNQSSGTPTFTLGSGWGSGATSSIEGTDLAGKITINSGTGSLTATTLGTITFNKAFPTGAKYGIFINAANQNAAGANMQAYLTTSSVSTTGFTFDSSNSNITTRLSTSTTYTVYYHVIQYE